MLACIVLWLYIAIVMRVMLINDGLPSDFEIWLATLIFLVGLLIGPLLASVTVLVCAVLMGPGGVYPGIVSADFDFWVRSTGLMALGLAGGTIQRIIAGLNQELDLLKYRTAGTNLPNLAATLEHLARILKKGRFQNKDLDVVNVRLGNLDSIRESAGQDTVDKLLTSLAGELQAGLGDGAYVSQLSGNELLGVQVGEGRELGQIHQLVKDLVATPINMDGAQYQLTAETGMHRSQVKANSMPPEQLIELAIKNALATKPDNVVSNASPLPNAGRDTGRSYSSLQIQTAMESAEIALLYEPRLNTRTGYFTALEGVVRWRHPRRGDLVLDDFKAMLDDESALKSFGAWLLKLGFADADAWNGHGYRFRLTLDVSINDVVSAQVLAYALNESSRRNFKPGWFGVEVSEKALIKADNKVLQYLRQLQSNQVSVVVSHYGEGGSTIQDMFMMPVDAVKFSPELIERALTNSDQRRQLGAMIKLIHSRGLVSIADGVRTSTALRMLRALACEELQGPLLSKALTSDAIPWTRIRV